LFARFKQTQTLYRYANLKPVTSSLSWWSKCHNPE